MLKMKSKTNQVQVCRSSIDHSNIDHSSIQQLRHLLNILQIECSEQICEPLPSVISFMSLYMIEKINNFCQICHYIQLPSSTNQQATNKIKIGALITLNNNLQPSLLSFAIQSYANTNQISLLESQLQLIYYHCQVLPKTIIIDQIDLASIVQKVSTKHNINIKPIKSISHKIQLMKSSLIDRKIRRNSYMHKQAIETIVQILQNPDMNKCRVGLQKFKKWSPQTYQHFIQQDRTYNFLSQMPAQFYGFVLHKTYDDQIKNMIKKYLGHHISQKSVIDIINAFMKLQDHQLQLIRAPFIDKFHILNTNSNIWQLKDYIEPKPYQIFLNNYFESRSLKYSKINQYRYLLGGKAADSIKVNKLDDNWECQCLYTYKIGIPCKHLIRVLIVQKQEIKSKFSKAYLWRQRTPVYVCQ